VGPFCGRETGQKPVPGNDLAMIGLSDRIKLVPADFGKYAGFEHFSEVIYLISSPSLFQSDFPTHFKTLDYIHGLREEQRTLYNKKFYILGIDKDLTTKLSKFCEESSSFVT